MPNTIGPGGGGGGGGGLSFLDLSDTPDSYSGAAGEQCEVDNNETGIVFAPDSASDSGLWTLDSETGEQDPGAGFWRRNATTSGSTTELYISEESDISQNYGLAFSLVEIGDRFYMQDSTNELQYEEYTVTDAPIDNGDWWTFPVRFDTVVGGDLAANSLTIIHWYRPLAFTQSNSRQLDLASATYYECFRIEGGWSTERYFDFTLFLGDQNDFQIEHWRLWWEATGGLSGHFMRVDNHLSDFENGNYFADELRMSYDDGAYKIMFRAQRSIADVSMDLTCQQFITDGGHPNVTDMGRSGGTSAGTSYGSHFLPAGGTVAERNPNSSGNLDVRSYEDFIGMDGNNDWSRMTQQYKGKVVQVAHTSNDGGRNDNIRMDGNSGDYIQISTRQNSDQSYDRGCGFLVYDGNIWKYGNSWSN